MKSGSHFRRVGALVNTSLLLSIALAAIPGSPPGAKTYAVNKLLKSPVLFAPGIVSTADDEFGGTFTPDGNSFYFVKRTQSTLRSNLIVICVSYYRNGKWTEPEVASFSGKYKDLDPFVSPDGSKLFFVSNRPTDTNPKRDTDIWYVEKNASGWGEPKNIGPPVNSDVSELGCSVTRAGTLYFVSSRKDSLGSFDIYRSRLVQGKYAEPENLGGAINSPAFEGSTYVAPDESYLLFSSLGREDAQAGGGALYPRSDLYISYFRDGQWTPAKNLGPAINSDAEDSNPTVSPDGKYLFFSSERNFTSVPMTKRINHRELTAKLHAPGNGLSDIYQVEMSVLEH